MSRNLTTTDAPNKSKEHLAPQQLSDDMSVVKTQIIIASTGILPVVVGCTVKQWGTDPLIAAYAGRIKKKDG